uniref:Uncharacterized protein n=1 Tax=Arundo donax TaxID=35708 RepID=A0A0A9DRV5_ARUDO
MKESARRICRSTTNNEFTTAAISALKFAIRKNAAIMPRIVRAVCFAASQKPPLVSHLNQPPPPDHPPPPPAGPPGRPLCCLLSTSTPHFSNSVLLCPRAFSSAFLASSCFLRLPPPERRH